MILNKHKQFGDKYLISSGDTTERIVLWDDNLKCRTGQRHADLNSMARLEYVISIKWLLLANYETEFIIDHSLKDKSGTGERTPGV